jgi:twitching motility protein PilT
MIDNDDIDALISELNASGGQARSGDGIVQVESLLTEVISRGGSDLFLIAGCAPGIRIDGLIVRLPGPVLDGTDVEEAVVPQLPPHARRQFQESGVADASIRFSGLGRFRVNLHRERGRAAAAIRVLPLRVPRFSELALPPEVEALSSLGRGLVLIGGATGSGKTTTMAALVDEINRRDARHIITVEDPIEYEHQHDRCMIEQVEIGADPTSQRPCAARSGKHPTFSSSAKCAIRNPCASRCQPPRLDISSSAVSTRRTSRQRSHASATRSPTSARTPSGKSSHWPSRR